MATQNFDYETILINLEKIYPIRLDDTKIEMLISWMKEKMQI